jgi:tetratricopeptide (TPR) repeat protein
VIAKQILLTALTMGSTLTFASSEISLDAALDRFEGASTQSSVEDLWAHQRRLVGARFSSAESRRTPEDALIKIEWYLRLGPARSPLNLDDLRVVREPKLLDEVLWSLLGEAVLGDLFVSTNDWAGIRSALAAFLSTHPLRKALLTTNHAAWWAWLQDLPSKGPTPWELSTLKGLLVARESRAPLAMAEAYCAAATQIPNDQHSVGLSVAREFRARLPEEVLKQRQVLRENFARKVSCQRLYSDLAEVYEERRLYDVASEQRSYALLQKLDSGSKLSSSEIRDVARYSFEAGEWRKAFEFYLRAREEGATDLDVRVRELVAGTRAANYRYKDTAATSQQFEDVLQLSFQSIYRDEVLRSYADFLEARGNMPGALEVWRWNYQYAASKEQRLLGLQRAALLGGVALERGGMGIERKAELLRWLDGLSVLRRLDPTSEVFSSQAKRAESRVKRLGLFGEIDVRASLEEVQKESRR